MAIHGRIKLRRFLLDYTPMHEVVPRAVRTAEIMDAKICSDHLRVSFFVIVHLLSYKLIICKP